MTVQTRPAPALALARPRDPSPAVVVRELVDQSQELMAQVEVYARDVHRLHEERSDLSPPGSRRPAATACGRDPGRLPSRRS